MSRSIIFLCVALTVVMCQRANAGKGQSTPTPFFWGVALDGYPITSERLAGVERETNISPKIVVFYLQWPSSPSEVHFPGESLEVIWKHKAIPCLTWEPMTYDGATETMIPYRQILEGSYDSYIKSFAQAARQWQKPFIIRFAHEMNTERYHWGTTREVFGPESPKIYQQMFRHIVGIFRRSGADNVLWTFCPNAESVPNPSYQPGTEWNAARNYYPGHDVVDILGMDGYNWGETQRKEKNGWDSRWQSFEEIFSPLHEELRSVSSDKPLIVFETASAGESLSRGRWLRDALAALDRWKVLGIVWFQANKEVDWRIDGSADRELVELVSSRSCSSPQVWIRQFMGERRLRPSP